ncbi:MAG: hypothetical protein RL466_471 [Actinomycetota bacterium]
MKKTVKSRALTAFEPEPDELSDALQELLAAVQSASARLSKKMEMGQLDLDAMQHIMNHPLTVTELANNLGVTSAAATQLVDRLVKRGHAQREPHAMDARKVVIYPSESGIGTVVQKLMPVLNTLSEIDKTLNAKERQVIFRYLSEAKKAFGAL